MASYVTELLVRLGWDGSAMRKGLAQAEIDGKRAAQRVEKELGTFTKRMGGQLLGGVGVMQGIRAFERIAEESAKISRESGKLGVTVERYQALQRVSEEFGMSVEDIQTNFAKLPQHIRDSVTEFERFSKGEKNISGLAQASRNIDMFKAAGAQAAGWGAGAVNWLGVQAGKGITKSLALWEAFRGNTDYANELMAQTLDTGNEEMTRRLETRLSHLQMNRAKEDSKGRVVGEFSTWLDYERGLRGIKREEAIKKAIEARGNLNIATSDSLAKIGGFNVGSDREGAMNIYRQQIQLLERIAKAVEKDSDGGGYDG